MKKLPLFSPALVLLALPSAGATPLAGQGACATGDLEAVGAGTPGGGGVPVLSAVGAPLAGLHLHVAVDGALPGAPAVLLASTSEAPLFLPVFAGTAYPGAPLVAIPFVVGPEGSASPLVALDPVPDACGLFIVAQAGILDPAAAGGAALTRAVRATFGAMPEGPLLPGRVFATGDLPELVSVADHDGDGRLDALVYSEADDEVQAFLGQGNGELLPGPTSALAGTLGTALAVADMDADGELDLVSADAILDAVSVQLGLGDGRFGAPMTVSTPGFPFGLALSDYDLDGAPDAALTHLGTASFDVLLGAGDGTLLPPRTTALPALATYIVTPDGDGDLNGDGAPDLLAYDEKIHVLLGAGDGTFTHAGELDLETTVLVAGDADGDGDVDLLGGPARWLEGNGDGTFLPPAPLVGVPVGTQPLLLAHLDADGIVDLVGHDSLSDSLPICHGVGGGAFTEVQDVAATIYTIAAGLGDLDGDGALELLVSSPGSDQLQVHVGRADGTFQTLERLPLEITEVLTVRAFDWNGDLVPDLVTGDDGPSALPTTLTFFDGQGDGSFGPPTGYFVASEIEAIEFADLDADGATDVVLADEFVYVLRGDGAGGLEQPGPILGEPPFGDGAVDVRALDLDGDGALDLLAANQDDHDVAFWRSNGDGSFQASVNAPVGTGPRRLATGDFDGDGVTDAVTVNLYSQDASLLVGLGDGTFAPEVRLPIGGGPGGLTAADLDLDGDLDLALTAQPQTTLFPAGLLVLLAGGGLAFTPTVYSTEGVGTTDLASADLDADGLPDLVHLASIWRLQVLRGQGGGAFAPAVDHSTTVFLSDDLELADLDGDFQIEAIVAGQFGVEVLRNLLLSD